MKFYDFVTTTYGKWILAGEHAVVRGHPAIVFPVKEKKLVLRYTAKQQALGADYTGSSGAEMHLLFWSVLEHGLQLLGLSLNKIKGHFFLDSSIPIGVGMGASASLCVAVCRWFIAQNWVKQEDSNEFARQLEDLFHGKSSGLDVAGVAAENGVYFKQGKISPFDLANKPLFYLSSCNQVGITSQCIMQVQQIWKQQPSLAKQIDLQMVEAVEQARLALKGEQSQIKDKLVDSINLALNCFEQWGLISENLLHHMNKLRTAGAIAVKPTGSGGGGFVLSLWDKNPPQELQLLAV